MIQLCRNKFIRGLNDRHEILERFKEGRTVIRGCNPYNHIRLN